MSIVQMLFSASGRIRRRDYWLWSIALTIANIAFFLLSNLLFSQGTSAFAMSNAGLAAPPAFIALDIVLLFLVQWINFNITAKRAHDRGRPAVVAAIVTVLTAVYSISLSYYATFEGLNTVLQFAMMFVGLWLLVDLGCLDGTKGPNKYGPSPKNIGTPSDVF